MNAYPHGRLAFAALALAVFAQHAHAALTEVLVDDSLSDFRNGDYTTSTLTYDGFVTAPAKREFLQKLDADIVWDVVREKSGRMVIATGHEGRLFALDGAEPAKLLHTFEEPALYALATMEDGTLLVGASPTGKIYKMGADGKPALFAATGQSLIWKLLPRADGSVLAATGPNGCIVRIDAKGTTTTLAKIPDTTNVMDLLDDGENVIAATQGKGLVVRVKPDGTVFVMADSEQEEIRRIVRRPDGTILAAANGVRLPAEKFFKRVPQAAPGDKREAKPKDIAFVFSIFPDGYADELWPSPEFPIHDISLMENGRLLVASGSKGSLFSIDAQGRTDVVGGSEQKILSRMARVSDSEWLIGTGEGATLQRLQPDKFMPGVFESRVFNMKGSARWGRMQALLTATDGLTRIATRTGNTTKADKTWSPWSETVDVPKDALPITSPTGRFIQYRVEFSPTNEAKAPRLDAVRLYYRQINQRPVFTSLEVKAVEPPKEQQKGGRGAAPGAAGRTGPVFVDVDSNQKMYDITWKSEDANQDTLAFAVFAQAAGAERWMPLGEEQSALTYRFDTRGVPDGMYRFKVEARDYATNAAGEEKVGEGVTGYYLVDNTSPDIVRFDITRGGAGTTVSAKAEDAASNIVAAAWRLDSGDWQFLAPNDDIFDDRSEIFEFRVPSEKATKGAVLTLIVTDDGGNTQVRSSALE